MKAADLAEVPEDADSRPFSAALTKTGGSPWGKSSRATVYAPLSDGSVMDVPPVDCRVGGSSVAKGVAFVGGGWGSKSCKKGKTSMIK